jgi:RimJ/RimL family protein N-acetyltransferase
MLSDLRPIVLRGNQIYLEPLEERHAAELFAIGQDKNIWRYLPRGPFTSEEDALQFVQHALLTRAFGNELQFVIRVSSTGAVIGTTRYQDIQPQHSSVEVGWTFVDPSQWFRGAGTESSFLLVQHAIEDLGAERVWWKTDRRNLQTQKTLEKCGVHREGVLRRHLRTKDGSTRDSVIYSVLPEEWPDVKQRAEELMARRWACSQKAVAGQSR